MPRDSVEHAPLLSPTESTFSQDTPTPRKKSKPWVVLVVLCLLLIAIVDMGAFLAEPPKTRIFEANICLSYYKQHDASAIGDDGNVPEKLCKIDEVQQKLAMIFGWQDTFVRGLVYVIHARHGLNLDVQLLGCDPRHDPRHTHGHMG